MAKTRVAIERGAKRSFAIAIDWPGWSRSGKDEASALQALVDQGHRYATVISKARLGFEPPKSVSDLQVVERMTGNATTDFGAPGVSPKADAKPMNSADLKRHQAILEACWRAFDAAVRSARGKTLRTGPRGGGRELGKIVQHVLEADGGYLSGLGWKHKLEGTSPKSIRALRDAMLAGMAASARGEIPAKGPRGGKRWTARYFVRRSAWHVLDHSWEIEDRVRL